LFHLFHVNNDVTTTCAIAVIHLTNCGDSAVNETRASTSLNRFPVALQPH
jgi:hypothetical protein